MKLTEEEVKCRLIELRNLKVLYAKARERIALLEAETKQQKERIKELGYQTVEFKDVTIKNTLNAPMYFLLFASKNPKGLHFWKEITKKDHSGQFELF